MIKMKDKNNYLPYYDNSARCWRVDFPDRDPEVGDLLYVASEFAMTGLYFPYNTSQTADKEYSGHSHSFEGVIRSLLDDPVGFTIAGFEEYYSQQELKMLAAIQKRLLEFPQSGTLPAKKVDQYDNTVPLDRRTVGVCEHCGIMYGELVLTADDEAVCVDCLGNDYTKCDNCGRYIYNPDLDSLYETVDGEHVCEDCADSCDLADAPQYNPNYQSLAQNLTEGLERFAEDHPRDLTVIETIQSKIKGYLERFGKGQRSDAIDFYISIPSGGHSHQDFDFHFEEEMIQVSLGGYVYDEAVGGDSYTTWMYCLSRRGSEDGRVEPSDFDSILEFFVYPGVKFSFEDYDNDLFYSSDDADEDDEESDS